MLTLYAVASLFAVSVHLGFSISYHVFIPAWIKNPFGRMIQFQSLSLCLVMGFVFIRAFTGHAPDGGITLVYALMFLLLAFSGIWQILMLSFVVKKNVIQGDISVRVEIDPPQEVAEEDSSEPSKI